MPSSHIIRPIRAFEGDTVEIQWKCKTGETWYERRTCPPKAHRDAPKTTESRSVEEVLPEAAKQALDAAVEEKKPDALD
jgi:predicted metal-binding protein